MHDDLIARLREHDDQRLYREADELMAEAADALEAMQADAERMKWVARNVVGLVQFLGGRVISTNGLTGLELRAAIDAARQAPAIWTK